MSDHQEIYPSQQVGEYCLVRKLGSGHFGTVYLAKHLHDQTLAAVKVFPLSLTRTDDFKKFLNEASTIRLRHPHIVPLLNFGISRDDLPFLVMEYAPEGTMRDRYPKGDRVPLSTIAFYVDQLASALQYAHEHRIIHRDIKPENILIRTDGSLLVSDFGIAKLLEQSSLVSQQTQTGTPAYMAPEQYRGYPCFASDQYALAVVVYEWICGVRPFQGMAFAVAAQHLHTPPPSMRNHLPTLSETVERIIFKALAKTPEDRFERIEDFADALREAIQIEPTTAAPSHSSEANKTVSLIPSEPTTLMDEETRNTIPLVLDEPTSRLDEKADAQHSLSLEQMQTEALESMTRSSRRGIEQQDRTNAPVPLSPHHQHNRLRMLRQVQRIWIDGLLRQSLYQDTRIELSLQDRPDMLGNPWRLQVQELDQAPQKLPDGTTIVQVYDKTEGELLILGEPGAGKTTLLLELTATLLERAEKDDRFPIPIVFNLSSWVEKRQSLSLWLVEELWTKYQVPRKIGRAWIASDQVLPLLDGLDEVAKDARSTCVERINDYYQSRLERGNSPMVVCCRSEEYVTLSSRILFQHAVSILPLTTSQINTYLKQAGEQVKALEQALNEDAELHELARQPLMLNLFTLAYRGARSAELPTGETREKTRCTIFARYVERMLQRRAVSNYTAEQTKNWLTWLAWQMVEHSQTEFYLERMQMDWLPASQLRYLLPGIVVGLVYGLFAGLVKGISFGFSQGSDQYGRSFTPPRGLIDGLLIGVLNALVFALLNGFVFGVLGERERARKASQAGGSWQKNLINILGRRPVYGLLFGVLNGLLITLLVDWPGGAINGLFFSIMYVVLGKLETQIQPAEVLTWSWSALRQNAAKFVVGGILIGFFYGLLTRFYSLHQGYKESTSGLLTHLLVGLSIGVVIGLTLVLAGGLSRDRLDKRNILKPNQGIWTSARNSVSLGLFSWLLFGLFFGGIYGVLLRLVLQTLGVPYTEYGGPLPKDGGLVTGLAGGLAVGAGFWVVNGGVACIQHLLLRIFLWRAGYTPWNYSRFLDSAAARILLHKVGGGYIFVHRLLLDYFASLEKRHRGEVPEHL